ncbi:hypothetical protein D3C80_1792940 [compost metagenome]
MIKALLERLELMPSLIGQRAPLPGQFVEKHQFVFTQALDMLGKLAFPAFTDQLALMAQHGQA